MSATLLEGDEPRLQVQRRLFSSADEMSRAMHGLTIEINVLRDGFFPYGLLSAHLGECMLDIGEVGASITAAGTVSQNSMRVMVPMQHTAAWYVNGLPCKPGQVAIFRPGAETFAFTGGPVRWAALQIPEPLWQRLADEFGAGAAAQRAGDMQMVEPAPATWRHLHQALRGAIALLRDYPRLAEMPQIRRTLRLSLVQAFAGVALRCERGASASVPGFLRARVVKAAEDYLRGHPDMLLLHVSDLCEAAAVSERTLRNAFNEAYGMGPMRYLRIRRLNQVRRLLLNPRPVIASVTEAAMRFEFFDLGRFARDYRGLFGEKPSETWVRLRGTRVLAAAL
ncbi:MAG TPA: helix-turn-helix domain-containing protein [Burkholderiales bacterium]|nr:helix-turn-helix domain-containing protein [Burkholderiales bacterium]